MTAYVLRFVRNLKAKLKGVSLVLKKYIIFTELKEAKFLWVKDNQSWFDVSSNDDLRLNLNLKKDDNGIIRSYSRLKHAKVPFDTKVPMIINKKHKLAELIVYHSHMKVLHRGVKQTLTEIRSQYWITRGRNFVKKLIYPCTVCKKLNARPYEYPGHSELPEFRFDDRFAFSSTGVDYLGPLYVLPIYGRDSDTMYKAFVVIYTCASTRAVVLDVVNDAKSSTFVDSFSRFIARRGCPNIVVSDNGSVFTAAETQTFVTNRFIRWEFTLQKAPSWGGMWERLVASLKRCIKQIVGVQKLTYIELQTLIIEIELVLNNRPIGVDFEDDYEDVLTPNHLTFGRRLESSSDVNDMWSIPNNGNLSLNEKDLLKQC